MLKFGHDCFIEYSTNIKHELPKCRYIGGVQLLVLTVEILFKQCFSLVASTYLVLSENCRNKLYCEISLDPHFYLEQYQDMGGTRRFLQLIMYDMLL